MLSGILSYAAQSAAPLDGSMLLALFALGHAVPLLCVAICMQGAMSRFRGNAAVRDALPTISGTLMLALAAYYVVLA
jgi:cytochrome c biogenesis protein CcdA